MLSLYEYLGIIVFFWSNEHEPIHVHGEYQGHESRAEIFLQDRQIERITFKNVTGKKPLPKRQLADFKTLVQTFAYDIVGKWEAFFEHGIKPKKVRITRRLQ